MARLGLRITALDGAARERWVGGDGLSIGGPGAGLELGGDDAARIAATIERVGDGWSLAEARPSGRIFVDHAPLVGPRRLAVGDRIYVGTSLLEVIAIEAASVAPAIATGPLPLPRAQSRGRAAIVGGGGLMALLGLMALALVLEIPGADAGPSAIARARARVDPVLRDTGNGTTFHGASAPIPDSEGASTAIRIDHEVIPGDTVASIAARYHTSPWRIAEDNRLSPDRPLTPGQRLRVDAIDPPLPRARLRAVVRDGDTWADLADRYGLGKAEIQGQNPGLGGDLPAGANLDLWVEPQIRRRQPIRDEVDFPVLGVGTSIGSPSGGRIDGGIEMPESPLYIRRNARIMFGSAHSVAALQRAIHRFRRAYAYEGVLVVADLSRPGGGPLPPHLSHQSGRDVDIWLPTLRGAYDESYLKEDRRPSPDEVNWPATWGLIDSLLETGSVQYIFLSKSIQDRLYKAAAEMGATPGELAKIQWQPEGVDDRSPSVVAPIRDAFGHTGHIHVRFRCGPGEAECQAHAARVEEP